VPRTGVLFVALLLGGGREKMERTQTKDLKGFIYMLIIGIKYILFIGIK